MKILALDSSQTQATICLIDDGRLVASETGSVEVAHSEALLPRVDSLLNVTGLRISNVDVFAAGVGPGSFTGIRIGCATIKALAQVSSKPIIPFSSLRALSLGASADGSVIAMANAYQGQVFVGWQDAAGVWHEDAQSAVAWCDANLKSESAVFCGAGAKLYWPQLALGREQSVRFHESVLYPDAAGILRAVLENKGNTVRYLDLAANYLRPSQAEIKLPSSVAKKTDA